MSKKISLFIVISFVLICILVGQDLVSVLSILLFFSLFDLIGFIYMDIKDYACDYLWKRKHYKKYLKSQEIKNNADNRESAEKIVTSD